jgi:hypothetical protein
MKIIERHSHSLFAVHRWGSACRPFAINHTIPPERGETSYDEKGAEEEKDGHRHIEGENAKYSFSLTCHRLPRFTADAVGRIGSPPPTQRIYHLCP